jgi:hypothetical protein
MPSRNQQCACRVPLDGTTAPVFARASDVYEWLADHGVRDVGPDHLGRASIPVADAQRLYDEAEVQSAIVEAARAEALVAHADAVAELREAVSAAFIAETGGAAVVSQDGLLIAVAERRAEQVAAGLAAAQAVWLAAPPRFGPRSTSSASARATRRRATTSTPCCLAPP